VGVLLLSQVGSLDCWEFGLTWVRTTEVPLYFDILKLHFVSPHRFFSLKTLSFKTSSEDNFIDFHKL
jgi:hypothetical protein